MNNIDRTIPPTRSIPAALPGLGTPVQTTANGIDIYRTEGGDQDLISIRIEVMAGSVFQSKPAVASLCGSMLTKGTQKHTADEIAEEIGFYGAHVQASVEKEAAIITLMTLNEHLEKLMPLLAETLILPTFPKDELETMCHRRKNRLEIKLRHVQTKSLRNFQKIMFGGTRYYTAVEPGDYNQVSPADLAEFHLRHYRPERIRCYIAGKNTERATQLLTEHFGSWAPAASDAAIDLDFAWDYTPQSICENDAVASQSTIFVGIPVISSHHPDFPALYFLNKLLGGHFGSRLMRNLRVEKGLTYGVRSYLTELSQLCYLTISTDVGRDHTKNALLEIKRELTRLTEEPIPKDEMDLVLHQIAGQLATSLDGPFHRSAAFMSLTRRGLDGDHYSRLLRHIHLLDADALTKTARRYFNLDRVSTSVVGGCPP